MYSAERERLILRSLDEREFVSIRDLIRCANASKATIHRDLERLADAGLLTRVRGGAKRALFGRHPTVASEKGVHGLTGMPFRESICLNRPQMDAIGRAAAALCSPGDSVMIDGGSTTLQMCRHLAGLNLQVLTNSLHVVCALLERPGPRVLVPAGQVFPEQGLIFGAVVEGVPRFHASRLFMGATAIGPAGLMQRDTLLVVAERRLIDSADEVIVLADSAKFEGPSGSIVCPLAAIDTVVTDKGIAVERLRMLERAGIRVIAV